MRSSWALEMVTASCLALATSAGELGLLPVAGRPSCLAPGEGLLVAEATPALRAAAALGLPKSVSST